MKKRLVGASLAVLLIVGSVASVRAMIYHAGWMFMNGSQVTCYAFLDYSEEFTFRGIEMWLYDPNDEVIAAGAHGDRWHHVSLQLGAESVGSGTYRCHVRYIEESEDDYVDYYLQVN